jgi:hypothetical protein
MFVEGALRAEAEAALAAAVRELEIRHTGGTPFFDALDMRLRDPYWFRVLYLRYLDEFCQPQPDVTAIGRSNVVPIRHPRIAVSGEFGRRFVTWLADTDWGLYSPGGLMLPGDLRHNDLAPLAQRLDGVHFVFLDDSYFKGRTMMKVAHAILDAGGLFDGAAVLYDGSRAAGWIPSFYRYHPDGGIE